MARSWQNEKMRLSAVRASIAAVCVLGLPTPCRAAEPEASGSPPECRAAFEEADLELAATHEPHLIRARELLRRCASSDCRPWMVADCAKSLVDVERRIPTVVLAAHDAGRSLVDARVREGNTWLVQQLDGRSIEVEPGVHELVLELPSGEVIQGRFVVEEGARLQRLDFEVPQRSAAPAPSHPVPATPHVVTSRRPTWLRPAGTIAAIAGLGALGLGTAFGIAAWKDRENANCDARGLCDREPLRRAESEATASTVGFAVGGAVLGVGLLALGYSLWVTRSDPSPGR